MTDFRVLRLSTILLLLAAVAPVSSLDAQFINPANGHGYYHDPVSANIAAARSLASFVGGHLVTVNDVAEQQWLTSTFASVSFCWIGLSDEIQEGVYLWDSGEPVTYLNWAPGEPSDGSGIRDYVRMANADLWSTAPGSIIVSSLIEVTQPLSLAISGFLCEPSGFDVQLSWQNGELYDSVEVYRDGGLLTSLPAQAESYLDTDPEPFPSGSESYFVVGRVGGVPSFPMRCTTSVLNPAYQLRMSDAQLVEGEPGQISSLLTNQDPSENADVQGFSYGACHDPALLEIFELVEGDAVLNQSQPPFFWNPQIFPDGYTIGAVFSQFEMLPEGTDQELLVATYQPLVAAPFVTSIDYCNTLSVPPVEIVVVHFGGSHLPVVSSGIVESVENGFVRGDCNGDGMLNLADASFTGVYLFAQLGVVPVCVAACDGNSDGVTDVADFVYGVSYLFSGGPPPAPPFPDCGPDPLAVSSCGTACP